jgi:dolichol-phosphate mannosyltransferase
VLSPSHCLTVLVAPDLTNPAADADLAARLHQILGAFDGMEVLVVAPCPLPASPTAALAEVARGPRVRFATPTGPWSGAAAHRTGLRIALESGFRSVATLEADHPTRFLRDLVDGTLDHDLVIGSRFVPGGASTVGSPVHRWLARAGNAIARVLLRLPTHDWTSGMRCYRCDLVAALEPLDDRATLAAQLVDTCWRAHRLGYRVGETPVLHEGLRTAPFEGRDARQTLGRVLRAALRRRARPAPIER